MKRFSVSFLLVACLMMILSIPAFAENMTRNNAGMGAGTGTGGGIFGTNNAATNTTTNNMDQTRNTTRGFGYDRVTTDGNFGNYGQNTLNGQGGGNLNNNRFRAAAANDNRMDWGWLGLAGLFGLAGLRGRNRETS